MFTITNVPDKCMFLHVLKQCPVVSCSIYAMWFGIIFSFRFVLSVCKWIQYISIFKFLMIIDWVIIDWVLWPRRQPLYWGYHRGTLSQNQVSATHLKINHPISSYSCKCDMPYSHRPYGNIYSVCLHEDGHMEILDHLQCIYNLKNLYLHQQHVVTWTAWVTEAWCNRMWY